MDEHNKIDYDKWKQYRQLTVDEAMNLISGFEPGTYKFCNVRESEMASNSVHIYRALAEDLIKFNIITHIRGEKADWPNFCRLVASEDYYNPHSQWWDTALLQVDDLKKWLNSKGFKSVFFETDNSTGVSIPDYLNRDLEDGYSPKLAAAVRVWEHFYYDQSKIKLGKSLKQRMVEWLKENTKDFGLLHKDGKDKGKPIDLAIEEIAKIANWKPEGGAPRQ